jgi:hypothetical protein
MLKMLGFGAYQFSLCTEDAGERQLAGFIQH